MPSLKYFIHKSIYSIQSCLIIAKNNSTSLFQQLVQAVILPQHGAYSGTNLLVVLFGVGSQDLGKV